MSLKNKSIGALFILLVLILAINPRIINNIYETLIGRFLLLCLTIFFASNNMTLGLITALVIITASNQYGSFVIEGMENNGKTIGDDNSNINMDGVQQQILTKSEAAKEKKNEENVGFDKEDIKAAIASKDSKTIPINDMKSSEDVSAFTSGMLKTSSLEGFKAYAPAF